MLAHSRLPVRERLRGPAASLLAGVSALVALDVRDPHRSGSYGHCPFLTLTGHPCPLCGGLRAVSDLSHGHLLEAVRSNVLAVLILVGGAGIWFAWTVNRARGDGHERPPLTSDARLARLMVVALVVFGVLRWLPGFSALSPS